MTKDKNKENKNVIKEKIYIALKTTKILCDKEYNLIKGKEISKEIPNAFIISLTNSNLIK